MILGEHTTFRFVELISKHTPYNKDNQLHVMFFSSMARNAK